MESSFKCQIKVFFLPKVWSNLSKQGLQQYSFTAEHMMIITPTPRVFVNASRSFKSLSQSWAPKAPIYVTSEYGAALNNGAFGCSRHGECYHLKFGGLDWTFVANFANGFRDQGNAGIYGGTFWVFGGKGNWH